MDGEGWYGVAITSSSMPMHMDATKNNTNKEKRTTLPYFVLLWIKIVFHECATMGRFPFRGFGLRVCLLDVAKPFTTFATLRNVLRAVM